MQTYLGVVSFHAACEGIALRQRPPSSLVPLGNTG